MSEKKKPPTCKFPGKNRRGNRPRAAHLYSASSLSVFCVREFRVDFSRVTSKAPREWERRAETHIEPHAPATRPLSLLRAKRSFRMPIPSIAAVTKPHRAFSTSCRRPNGRSRRKTTVSFVFRQAIDDDDDVDDGGRHVPDGSCRR